jgi:hypothetical protein
MMANSFVNPIYVNSLVQLFGKNLDYNITIGFQM